MDEVLPLACDEAGNTGPFLLDKDQRFFAFSSVSVDDAEADAIIREGLRLYPVQMPELKASRLLRTPRGQSLVRHVLSALQGRFATSIHDKQYALCCWFFEYVFEPVFKEAPWLLYEKNLHRFVATITYMWLRINEAGAQERLDQFQLYMRTLDERQAPLLFSIDPAARTPLCGDPFESIFAFIRGYRTAILEDNSDLDSVLPDNGRWILDLSTTSLWAHLNHWGRTGRPLALFCDESKPLRSHIETLTGDDKDPGIRRSQAKGRTTGMGWTYARPPRFVDSKHHPSVQLADIVAGASVFAMQPGTADPAIRSLVIVHALDESIVPRPDCVDPTSREASVNAAILYRLAWKAQQGLNPYVGLKEDYAFAEAGWDTGALRVGGPRTKRKTRRHK
jgi:hypothetical protein